VICVTTEPLNLRYGRLPNYVEIEMTDFE